MSEPTMVYLLSRGQYSDYAVTGVFATPEEAMAAAPKWDVPGVLYPGDHDWEEDVGLSPRSWSMFPAWADNWEVRELPLGKVVR